MLKKLFFFVTALVATIVSVIMFSTIWITNAACEKDCGAKTETGHWERFCVEGETICYTYECSQHVQGCTDHFNDWCGAPYNKHCYPGS